MQSSRIAIETSFRNRRLKRIWVESYYVRNGFWLKGPIVRPVCVARANNCSEASLQELQSREMADHLVAIYGTEKDKINCPFYHKTGACRHGDRCARVHDKPLFSQTILLRNMYVSPDQVYSSAVSQGLSPPNIPRQVLQHHFEDFYADVFDEMARYGSVESIFVCQNMADHLVGNTYVKFADERSAQNALKGVAGRWYAGRVVKAEFSPVTDFREGKCRPFEQAGRCERGDFCHFMHLRPQPRWASGELEEGKGKHTQWKRWEYNDRSLS